MLNNSSAFQAADRQSRRQEGRWGKGGGRGVEVEAAAFRESINLPTYFALGSALNAKQIYHERTTKLLLLQLQTEYRWRERGGRKRRKREKDFTMNSDSDSAKLQVARGGSFCGAACIQLERSDCHNNSLCFRRPKSGATGPGRDRGRGREGVVKQEPSIHSWPT